MNEEFNCPKPSSSLNAPCFYSIGPETFYGRDPTAFYEYRPWNLSYRPKVFLHSSLNMFILKAL